MIATTLDKKARLGKIYNHQRDHFAFAVGLVPKAKGCKLADVPTVSLPRMEEEYPPSGHDIYETDAAHAIWEEHRKTTPYPDPRGGRTWKPFHKLDPDRLQYTVHKDESVIIKDSKSGEIVCVIIRNFSNNKVELLEWINGVIIENNEARKSVRVGTFPRLCFGYHLSAF